jgi:hypothetical protein
VFLDHGNRETIASTASRAPLVWVSVAARPGTRDRPLLVVPSPRSSSMTFVDPGRVDGLDPDRAWAWCQAMAVVLGVGLLIGRGDEQGGEAMLALAPGSR